MLMLMAHRQLEVSSTGNQYRTDEV